MKTDHVVIYHGTGATNEADIRVNGLMSPKLGYDSPAWYMVAGDKAFGGISRNWSR